MSRWLSIVFAWSVITAIVGVPVWYSTWRFNTFRNFRVVEDGQLYRSGQLTRHGFETIVSEYGIKSVITLRYSDRVGENPPDHEEEQWCRQRGIHYLRIRPQRWWKDANGDSPADPGVRSLLATLDDPKNHPVLIHCFAGIHRTGAHVAIYRMEYSRWTNEQALEEMRTCGYDHLDDEWDVLEYLSTYRPRWRNASVFTHAP